MVCRIYNGLAKHTQVHKKESKTRPTLYENSSSCWHYFRLSCIAFFFSYYFVSLLEPFWWSLPPFWAPFGALGLSFGTLGPSFGALGPQAVKKQIWRKLGENSGSKSDFILWQIFSIKKKTVLGRVLRRSFF